MHIRNQIAMILAGAVLIIGSGCTNRTARDDSMIFDIQGPVAVDVESFNGDVRVIVDERLTEGRVQVTRTADHGHRRWDDSLEALDSIDYSAELTSDARGPVLMVKTWSTHPESHYQRANVTIKLPGVSGLRVSTIRGEVRATDTEGETSIATQRGDVRFMTNRAMTAPVKITAERGSIDYRVRGDSSGMILADAADGEVMQRHKNAKMRITEANGSHMVAILNDGTNPIELRSAEGDVRIAIVPDPTAVGVFIWSP
ncbi:MAG: DUF4097 family beta strand repeat-containing protein [Phycisphaerales bacterium]